jgi:hypothetical protein
MGVSTQIAKDLLRTGERFLDIDVPPCVVEPADETGEFHRILEILDACMQGELSLIPGLFQEVEELASDLVCKSTHGNKELAFGFDPLFLSAIQTACGDHQVQVRVKQQVLVPGMQDGGKADLSFESLPISTQLKKGSSRSFE